MIPPLKAAWEVHEFLTRAGVPYAITGNIALQCWGEPRKPSRVIDVTVAAPFPGREALIRRIVERFPSTFDGAIALAERSGMLLVRARKKCTVCFILGLPGYAHEVVRRAVPYELEPGKVVRVASAEDLIIYSALAGGRRELRDLEGIVDRQRDTLDATHIRRWLRESAVALDSPDMLDRFEEPWKRDHP